MPNGLTLLTVFSMACFLRRSRACLRPCCSAWFRVSSSTCNLDTSQGGPHICEDLQTMWEAELVIGTVFGFRPARHPLA